MSLNSSITNSVLDFYKTLPFNMRGSTELLAKSVRDFDPETAYPCLAGLLDTGRMLEVGCGVGWFSNSVAFHNRCSVTGLDINPVAVEQAYQTAANLNLKTSFVVEDLFTYSPIETFDLVISLGVLHHTFDCHSAIEAVCKRFVKYQGHLLLGLYHKPGRLPFLKHFQQMKARGSSNLEMKQEFLRLRGTTADDTHLESWFRDQVLHPHETQHTYAEIREVLEALDFKIISTSINNFRRIRSHASIEKREMEMESISKSALREGRYFPGFFLVLAQNTKL